MKEKENYKKITHFEEGEIIKSDIIELQKDENVIEDYTENEKKVNLLKCDFCYFTVKQKGRGFVSLTKHYESVHLHINYPCDLCGKNLGSGASLNGHKKAYHRGPDSILLKCDFCDYTTSWGIGNLASHHKSVHLGIRYTCNKCERKFSTKVGLDAHNDTIHRKLKFSCQICGHQFMRKSSIPKHRQFKHEGLKHSCSVCQTTFSEKSSLKRHKEAVHDRILYKCSVCDYATKTMYTLKKHKKIKHTEIKNSPLKKYSCSKCNKEFLIKKSLDAHIKSIHEEKKYQCKQCEYQAYQKGYLTKHIKAMHSELFPKFECSECDKKFSRKFGLNKHRKFVHSKSHFAEKYKTE